MVICHFSDWHGRTHELPFADVYVCTGDMLPNFPLMHFEDRGDGAETWEPNVQLVGEEARPNPTHRGLSYLGRSLVREREVEKQSTWVERNACYRDLFTNRDAPVVVVRGNHDFVDLAPLFVGGPVLEVREPWTEGWAAGRTWVGCRGINYIAGEWSDELRAAEFDERSRSLPDTGDILVSHAPPAGILDEDIGRWGAQALMSYHTRRSVSGRPLRAHLFGHVHGTPRTTNIGGTLFSNAATGWLVVEI